MVEHDEYLTTREAAQRAKVTNETIIDWCNRGYITCTKSWTRRWRISLQSLLDFLRGEDGKRASS
jgi:excisionase family DNA binding protein